MEKARTLDETPGRLIVDGFIAYGRTYSELNQTRAKLLDQLRLYIDLPRLSQEDEALTIETIPSPTPSTLTNNCIDDGIALNEWEYWDGDNVNLSKDYCNPAYYISQLTIGNR